jgi:hypothetical protein
MSELYAFGSPLIDAVEDPEYNAYRNPYHNTNRLSK